MRLIFSFQRADFRQQALLALCFCRVILDPFPDCIVRYSKFSANGKIGTFFDHLKKLLGGWPGNLLCRLPKAFHATPCVNVLLCVAFTLVSWWF